MCLVSDKTSASFLRNLKCQLQVLHRSVTWAVLCSIYRLYVPVSFSGEVEAAGEDQTAVVNDPLLNVQGHTEESSFHIL